MSCLSDLDLAALHRSRLEEKVHYKLSWLRTRRYTTSNECIKYSKNKNDSVNNNNNSVKSSLATHSLSNNNNNIHIGYSDSNNSNNMKCDNQKYKVISDNIPRTYHSELIDLNNKNNNNNHSVVHNNNFTISSSNSSSSGFNDDDNISSSSSVSSSNDDSFFSMDTAPSRTRSGTWPRTRSLTAPSPVQQFGPCGRIMKNTAIVMQIQDPASQRLTWYKPPLAVLVIKKVRDSTVLAPFVQLVEWLIQEKRMVVWVENAVLDDPLLLEDKKFQLIKDKLVTFKDGRDDLTDRIDFIICLGGDGTLLYASLLFQQSVPPVMAFHLGSLGFLTPFQFDNFQEQVTNVLEGHAALTLRSRLRCIIVRKHQNKKEKDGSGELCQQNSCSDSHKPSTNILVLNEVVIDRGPSPYLSNIDLFLDGKHITSVQGDGLIVSTPTGSTAYAVAAGASMIHPSVPAIMVTPICPHSLSFRPIVVPAGVELKISVSPDSRNTSWVSFDGRNRQELFHGDSLRVTTSIYPVPSICAQDQISDWFDSLAECLHWNVRKRQKCLDELSDLTNSGSEDTLDELERGMESLDPLN